MHLCKLQCSSRMSHRFDNLFVIREISLDMNPEESEETVLNTILFLLKDMFRNDTK